MRYLSVLLAAVAVLFAGPANSQLAHDAVVVTGKPVTFSHGSTLVTQRIEDGLHYPRMMGHGMPSGTVSVKFGCSDSGQPSAVTLLRRSGNGDLDHAAMRAISHIKTLQPMPVSFRNGQTFIANILFASSFEDYDRQLATLRSDAQKRNARYLDQGRSIALTIDSRAGAAS